MSHVVIALIVFVTVFVAHCLDCTAHRVAGTSP